MSAGIFVNAVYSATYDGGTHLHPIRVQPETLAATAGSVANGATDTPANSPISAMVSKSRRGLGLHARMVHLKSVATPPTGYKTGSTVRIPALQEAFYNACAITGTSVTYLSTTWVSTGVSAEEVR